jgi:murein L,D-transpeptidase YcbB/YkuD
MRSARFEQLLAGSAVALALTLTSYSNIAFAAPEKVEKTVTAAVPDAGATLTGPAATLTAPAETAAPAPKATPDATSSVAAPAAAKTASSDTAVVEKLRDSLAAGKFDRILGGKKERTDVAAFYATRDNAPLWIADGALSDRAKATVAYLAGVAADGLDPADYPTPTIKAGMEPDAQAEAEIKFTDTVLNYARHALDGRVHYSRVSGDVVYTLAKVEPAEILGQIAKADNVATALDSLEPQHPQYKALKAELAKLRGGASDVEKPMIPDGPVLKYVSAKPAKPAKTAKKGKEAKEEVKEAATDSLTSDPRVPALRKWFSLKDGGDTNYDKELADTIAKFQKEHRIAATGQLNQATLEAINGPKREKTEDIIVANLERWRWVPRDLGKSYVMVNIPDYTLRVVHDGKLLWKTKVVVGQPGKPTPLLSADMKYITVNPTWNVPPSIIQNEYLPALQQDPQAMDRIGLKVEQNPDGTVRIYQPPGDRNALGRIRFNFPNKFLVYQHDTPDKYLFAHAKRAYSHGCMRVENPLKYGEVILGIAVPQEHYTAERLQKMFGGSEININFPNVIPDHLTYQTAFVDDDGKLQIRDDVYGRDQKLLAILKNSAERKVADIAIERKGNSSSTPVKMPPGTFGSGSSGGGLFSGPSFFDRLFGGGEAAKPPARVGRRASNH